MTRFWLVCLALVALSADPLQGTAWAADPEDAARETFRDAKRLYDAHQYKAALAKFQAAYQRTKSPNARLYLARCHRQLGDLPAAYDELAGTVRDASDPRYEETRNAAAAELVLLEPKVGRLIITIDESTANPRVTMNGKPVDPKKLGEPITVKPGTFAIAAQAGGKEVTEKVTVPAGRTITVGLAFEEQRAPSADPPAPKRRGTALADESSFSTLETAGVIVTALGGAVLVAGAVAGAVGAAQAANIQDVCTTEGCREPEFSDAVSTATTLEIISYVGLSVGIAGVMGGIAMTLLGRSESDTAYVAPLPGGGIVGYTGSF